MALCLLPLGLVALCETPPSWGLDLVQLAALATRRRLAISQLRRQNRQHLAQAPVA
jgi:hypothetical protein